MEFNSTTCFDDLVRTPVHDSRFKRRCMSAFRQQSGAAGACWAHNPKVGGSKPPSAMTFYFFFSHHTES